MKAVTLDSIIKDAVKTKYGFKNYILADCTGDNKVLSGIGKQFNIDSPVVYYLGTHLKNHSMGNVFAVEIMITMNLKEVELILGKN